MIPSGTCFMTVSPISSPFHPASGSQPGLGGSRRVWVSSDGSLAFLILAQEFQVWSQHLPPQGSHSLPTCSATSFSAAAQTPQGLLQEERKEPGEKAPLPFLKLRQAWRWPLSQPSLWGLNLAQFLEGPWFSGSLDTQEGVCPGWEQLSWAGQ